jgi:hypothetical protein
MMKTRMVFFCLTLLLASWTSTAASFPDPHGHVVDVHKKPWSTLKAFNIKLVLDERPLNSKKEKVVLNQSKTMMAYITWKYQNNDGNLPHIWIEYLQSGQVPPFIIYPFKFVLNNRKRLKES